MPEWSNDLEEVAWRVVDYGRSMDQLTEGMVDTREEWQHLKEGIVEPLRGDALALHIMRFLEIAEQSNDLAARIFAVTSLMRVGSESYPWKDRSSSKYIIKRLESMLNQTVLNDYINATIEGIKVLRCDCNHENDCRINQQY